MRTVGFSIDGRMVAAVVCGAGDKSSVDVTDLVRRAIESHVHIEPSVHRHCTHQPTLLRPTNSSKSTTSTDAIIIQI